MYLNSNGIPSPQPSINYVPQMNMTTTQTPYTCNVPNMPTAVVPSKSIDPDSNVFIANLPCNYSKEQLYNLFRPYGPIMRYKYVTPSKLFQAGYGFVQFAHRQHAQIAIQSLKGCTFPTGETISLSIALRRSDEPTNLYVKHLPPTWTNDTLRQVFGVYGAIQQSKLIGNGVGLVRYENHEQALNAIAKLDKKKVHDGCKLKVQFATRKPAANKPQRNVLQSNTNNLYICNLPQCYDKTALEMLFANYGQISCTKNFGNGVAFVRFVHAADAKRAIQELNGKRPPKFDKSIVVELAHYDIFDNRNPLNRWVHTYGGKQPNSAFGTAPIKMAGATLIPTLTPQSDMSNNNGNATYSGGQGKMSQLQAIQAQLNQLRI
eukprot:343760_1